MKRILEILFVLGVICSLIHFVFRDTIFTYLIIGCGFFLLCFYISQNLKRYITLLIFLSFIFVMFLIRIMYYQSTNNMLVFVLFLAHFGYALFLIENKKSFKIFRKIYITISIILALCIFMRVPLMDISEFSSGNIVNYIFLAFSILYIGLYYKNNEKIVITPAVLSVIVSFYSLGRSGILISVFLFLGLTLLKFKNKVNKMYLGLIIIIISVGAYPLYKVLNNLLLGVMYKFGKKDSFIEGNPRADIIGDYFRKLDIKKVLFGYDNQETFNGYLNLHNSFLDFHYNFGFIAIIIIMFLLILLFYFLIKNRLVYFMLLISLLLRSFTDTVMLVGMYDFILLYLALVYYTNHYKKST